MTCGRFQMFYVYVEFLNAELKMLGKHT